MKWQKNCSSRMNRPALRWQYREALAHSTITQTSAHSCNLKERGLRLTMGWLRELMQFATDDGADLHRNSLWSHADQMGHGTVAFQQEGLFYQSTHVLPFVSHLFIWILLRRGLFCDSHSIHCVMDGASPTHEH